jgi:hypothetical protein
VHRTRFLVVSWTSRSSVPGVAGAAGCAIHWLDLEIDVRASMCMPHARTAGRTVSTSPSIHSPAECARDECREAHGRACRTRKCPVSADAWPARSELSAGAETRLCAVRPPTPSLFPTTCTAGALRLRYPSDCCTVAVCDSRQAGFRCRADRPYTRPARWPLPRFSRTLFTDA